MKEIIEGYFIVQNGWLDSKDIHCKILLYD